VKVNFNVCILKTHPIPYFVLCNFPFNRPMQADLKAQIPGAHYAGDDFHGWWVVPVECLLELEAVAHTYGLEVVDKREDTGENVTGKPASSVHMRAKFHPYQIAGVKAALQDRAHMLAFDMGLGKTAAAIEAMRKAGVETALIIAPASVRLQWKDQLDQWWPEHPDVYVLEKGARAKLALDPFVSTSYELAKHLVGKKFDAVVIDESHYLSNAKSVRSKIVREILRGNPSALTLFLTGTPIMNEPWQLWNQLDTLYPGRFGRFGTFCERYCNIYSNDYSAWSPGGINTEHASELRDRLSAVCTRATKKEWGHLLPPFTLTPVRVRSKRKFNPRELLEQFSRMDLHNADGMDALIRGLADSKVEHAVEYAENAMASVDRLVILTHLKATGTEIAVALREKLRGVEVFYMDGDISTKQRNITIENALAVKKGVLVATMHSVKEGINSLVGFDQALIAELYWSPGLMAQVLGRFERLNGSCNVGLMVVEGTHEEVVAQALITKMGQSSRVLAQSGGETALDGALKNELSEEEEFSCMQDVIASRIKEAYL
jgi:SWI/SNF-related matrix-associated actin-dependent regulator 1 of chromatin subfamily A